MPQTNPNPAFPLPFPTKNTAGRVSSCYHTKLIPFANLCKQLGSLAGANFEGDLCEAMDYFKSPHKCPFSGGFYPGLIFSQYPIPKIPGAGIFIKRVDITLKIFKMIDGVKTPESPLWACFGATVPVRSSL